jgi:hypothetical protein
MINSKIHKFMNILSKRLKNKNNLHEPYLDSHDKRYVIKSISEKQVSTYGYYTKLFD